MNQAYVKFNIIKTMRLKIFFTSLLIGVALSATAQRHPEDFVIQRSNYNHRSVNMIYGIMAGVSIPELAVEGDYLDINNSAGFQIGMMWGVDMGDIEVVPEIWYQYSKASISESSALDAGEITINSVEVPILLAFDIAGSGLRINVGPSLSLMSSCEYVSDDGKDSYDLGRIRATAGYLVGVSMTLQNNIIFDLRYTGRFGGVTNASAWGKESEDYKYEFYNLGLSVGYRF